MWDPLPQLLRSPEPAARWIALTALEGRPADDPDVVAAHSDVLADAGTQDLLSRLVDWEVENPVSAHEKPQFAPNLLGLLAVMGVSADDDPRIAGILEAMLRHQAPDGRFLALQRWKAHDELVWSSLPCDHHAIVETLVVFGLAGHPAVQRGLTRMLEDLTTTRQGVGWLCLPDPRVGFRGPGRKGDMCPQVTLEALRALSHFPDLAAAPEVHDAGRSILRSWRDRGETKPYMFGHGRGFKRGKWPPTWYSALTVTDTLGRYPAIWDGPDVDPSDRSAMAEIAACLLAYTVSADGQVTPFSVYQGFGKHTFGQKKRPSDVAAAFTAVALDRVEPLWRDIEAIDVAALPGSGPGGSAATPPGFASWSTRLS